MNSAPAPTGSRPTVAPSIQEFSIRVPKNSRKRHNVMRFNANLNVDIAKWTQVKMERENNAREYKGYDEEMPKFGAGSEFGRDAREEARRKRFGITARKYKPENQPWILKTDGKTGKKFKGIREGGIGENAAYYVFTHAPDGAIEAFSLHEWYNFQPIQRYKTLSFEEVEDEMKRRVKRMNYWSLMDRKKKKDNENDDDPENVETNVKDQLALQITENEEWMKSDDDESESDEEGGKKKKKDSDDDDYKDDDKKSKNKKKPIKKKKKKKRDSDDEAFEESDDGDEEGRECEYLTDSTDSEDEVESKEVKSVAEEDGLRKALVSDEDDEEENDEEKKDDDEFEEDEAKDEKDKAKETEKKKDKKKKKKPKKKDVKKNSKDSSLSEDSSDSNSDSDSPKESKEINGKKLASAHNSRSSTPTVVAGCSTDNLKRKAAASPDLSQVKKIKTETPTPAQVPTTPISGSNEGITEEAVRRYLMRKPMTTTELLQKFKSKKTGITSDKLVVMMTQILKKINPTRQTIKTKMYLSLKAQPH